MTQYEGMPCVADIPDILIVILILILVTNISEIDFPILYFKEFIDKLIECFHDRS